VPAYLNFWADVIGKWVRGPTKSAMLWVGHCGDERVLTFVDFAEYSSRAANAFSAQGIAKVDPVLVMLPRIPEWWETILGLMLLGAIPIPCTTLLTPDDIQFRFQVSEARAFITDQQGAHKFGHVHG